MGEPRIDFRFVKEHATFPPVLAHYDIVLPKRGGQRPKVLCPFHEESKGSCTIFLDASPQTFHCFGCGAKGNILEFVTRIEEAELRDAAKLLGEICDIDLAPPQAGRRSATTKPPKKTAAKRSSKKAAPKKAANAVDAPADNEPVNPPLTFELKLDPEHPYLAERGVSPEVVGAFGIGYCGRGMMRNRICFPIHNEAGELVAYAGRWAEDEVPEDEEKYLLPPKFLKSRVVFNLHRIEKVEHLTIVESYWSVLRLHELGIPAVSPMGRSISEEQLRLLRALGAPLISVMFDGDEPGRAATEAVLPALAESFYVHVAPLPDGEKPHSVDLSVLEQLVWHP